MTNRDTRIGSAIAAATCSLLGATIPSRTSAEEAGRWDIETALLYYAEGDDRVQDASAVIAAKRDFEDERYLDLGLSVDS